MKNLTKKIKILLMLTSVSFCYSQKVSVEDYKGNILIKCIDKQKIDNALNYLPNGPYYLTELKAVKMDDTFYFRRCIYVKKKSKNINRWMKAI